MSDQVNVRDEEGVRWLEICRPESKNGLTPEVNEAVQVLLYTAFEAVNRSG